MCSVLGKGGTRARDAKTDIDGAWKRAEVANSIVALPQPRELTDIFCSRKESRSYTRFPSTTPPLKMTCSLANHPKCTSSAVPPGMHADEIVREPPRRDILSLTANYNWENLQCVKKIPSFTRNPISANSSTLSQARGQCLNG